MADDVEIHFDPQHGELHLSCGDEAFERVRDAVLAAADLGAAPIDGVPAGGIRVIVIAEVPSTPAPPNPPSRLYNSLALLGCGIVAAGATFVLIVGIRTITSWIR